MSADVGPTKEQSTPEEDASFKGFAKNVYEDYLKNWIDFRDYLHQRRKLLDDPRIIGDTEPRAKNWRSPLKFAIQGTVFVALLVSLINGAFELSFKATHKGNAPKTESEEQLDEVRERLSAYSRNPGDALRILRAEDFPPGRAVITEGDIKANLAGQIADLEEYILFERNADKAKEGLDKLIVASMLFLSAFFFSKLVRIDKNVEYVCNPRVAYLYLITAHTFWFNLTSAIAVAVVRDLQKYWPEEFPNGFASIAVIFIIVFYIFEIARLSKAARGMRDLGYENMWYVQLSSKISLANFLALLCCLLVSISLAAGYGVAATAIQQSVSK